MTDPVSSPSPALTAEHETPTLGRHLWCLAAVVALIAVDLWSKSAAFEFLDNATLVRDNTGHDRHPVLGGWLGLMRNLNYGAAFGQLNSIPTLLVALRGVAVIVLMVLIVRIPRGQSLYLVALVLILSGAAGNLYDNLFHRPFDHDPSRPFGPVRDFIDVYFARYRWHFPTFNVADSCISIGAVLLILSGMVESKGGKACASEQEGAARAGAESQAEAGLPGA